MFAEGRSGLARGIPALALAVCSACAAAAPAPASPAPADVPASTGRSCQEAAELPLGRVVVGSTRGSGDALDLGCTRGEAPERIYRFDVPRRSLLRASLQADFDAALAVRRGCDEGAEELACNDDAHRGQAQSSRLEVTLAPGHHTLIVDGARGGAGDFELFASLEPIETPEVACAAAQGLDFDQGVFGSTRGIPDRFQATCGRGARAGEQVFALRVDEPSRLRVWQQAEYDGVLYLREHCEQPASELACNDDYRGSQRSLLTARVGVGTHYLFTDGLDPSQQGAFSLRVERGPLEPGAASLAAVCELAGALPVQPGVTAVDTFHEPSLTAGGCGGQGAPEAVVAVDVAETSRLRAHLRDPELNAVLYLRDRCAEVDRELACEVQARVDRGRAPGSPAPRGLDVEVQPGRHFLFVDGQSETDFGAAHLELALIPSRELQARCDGAPPLRDGDVVEGRLTEGPDQFGASCGGEARGSEHLYALRLASRSLVRLELDSSFDGVLHLRAECTDPDSELECSDDAAHSRHSGLTRVLDAGQYVVVVDGFDPTALGPYRLSAHLSPAP